MKKKVLKLVALIVISAIPQLSLADGGSINYTVTYDFSGLSLGTCTLDGVTYTTVNYSGLYNSGRPGTPSLPIDYIRFSVPYNAANFTVTAISGMTSTIPIDYMVSPIQETISGFPVTSPDISAYNNGYPSQLAWVVDDCYLASENHIVTVAMMPITYSHSIAAEFTTDILTKNESLNLTLSYEIDASIASVPIRKDDGLREEGYQFAKGIVVNPDNVETFAFNGGHEYGIRDGSINENYKYLIVTTPELLYPMRRLAALKRQKGISVKVVTVEEAVNSPIAQPGDSINFGGDVYYIYTDNAGKLRQYLRHSYYDYGTDYVLMAGYDVPHRDYEDMYFCDLGADWYTMIDHSSELYVGRLLGSRPEQFKNYIDKLFRYELNPGNGDYSYLRKVLCTDSKIRDDFSMTLSNALPVYTHISEQSDGDYPTGCAILDSIGVKHYGLWGNFHQSTPFFYKVYGTDNYGREHYIWATDSVHESPNSVNDTETGNGLNMMANKNYPMICFSGYGITMPFRTIPGYAYNMNLGESFTMGKDYGGPVYMGLTKNVKTIESLYFASCFAGNLSSGYSLGQAYALAKLYLINDDGRDSLLCYHNYLGDPGLYMWTDTPQNFSGLTVSRNNNSITVYGISAPSTIVSYYSNEGETGSITTSSASVTINDVSPNSTLMVYRQGFIPYIAPLVLQNISLEHSQYVIANDVLAGKAVDVNRTNGNVTVKSGIEYEIEAKGNVRLASGFNVEKGARFAVHPSSF